MTNFTAETLRQQMPITQHWTYFDHPAVAPLPQPTSEAVSRWLKEWTLNGDTSYPLWDEKLAGFRKQAATLIGADLDEIAYVPNTTAGVNFVSLGIDWQPGDNLVTRADEFPSNLYPWMMLEKQGVEVRQLTPGPLGQLDPAAVDAACDARTRLVSLSWVAYANGWRHDLDAISEIAQKHNALFFVDAIQGLGVFPLDVEKTHIDFLAADGHKWMLGPEGAGVFYSRKDALEKLQPVMVGWNSVEESRNFHEINLQLKKNASRYEGGTYNVAGYVGLESSLKLLNWLTPEVTSQRVLELTDHAAEVLQQAGGEILSDRSSAKNASGILSFHVPGKKPEAIRERCIEAKIALSCRAGRLRIGPHAYNTEAEIDALAEVVREA